MEDYDSIIAQKEEWLNQKGEVLRFDFVRYHFNDAETQKIWEEGAERILKDPRIFQSSIDRTNKK